MTPKQTTHTTVDEIDGHEVKVVVKGPESQMLDDDADRIGADVLARRINDRLGGLKGEIEVGGDDA
jgi:hypothetical protein